MPNGNDDNVGIDLGPVSRKQKGISLGKTIQRKGIKKHTQENKHQGRHKHKVGFLNTSFNTSVDHISDEYKSHSMVEKLCSDIGTDHGVKGIFCCFK